ncbi:MAG: XRE family transcriptional regulator [Lachnobacterium sp.]|nr:XRE family transcriptional regulator [Lachnobacterium sp.]
MGLQEDILREYILSKYKSIREFTIDANMPYSTVDSIFKRGLRKSSVDNLLLICKHLGISADALLDGEIRNVSKSDEPQTIAAHFDGDEYTEEELSKIKEFAEFVKSSRK